MLFRSSARGLARVEKREYDQAIADYTKAIESDPTYTAAYTNRGLAYERKVDPERARNDFQKALATPQKFSNGKWAHDTAKARLAALTAPKPAVRPSDKMQPPSVHSGPRVALVIANAKYEQAEAPLNHAAKDGGALADELKRSGFEVEFRENLTKQRLQEAIEKFKKNIKSGSAALLYFCG